MMDITGIPPRSAAALLADFIARDGATARRTLLVKILLQERYLTRQQLIVRVEGVLGNGCFGASAWEDVFYRDMTVVKKALAAAGFRLGYSRSTAHPGYFFYGQPKVSVEFAELLRCSAAEVTPAQIAIFSRMSMADRFRLGCSATDTARNAVAYRIRQQHPSTSPQEAAAWAVLGRER
jgi:hypothetical protein